MELVKAIILGAVQGITEFLPVSSTGHLILFEKFLGISQEIYGLTFDAALHIGTLFAILIYFRKEWLRLFSAFGKIITTFKVRTQDEKLMILLLLATIPGALFGLLFDKMVETNFRSPILVAVMLILFSFVLIYVEKQVKKTKTTKDMQTKDAILIGLSQAVALIPGVSRSGITIATGMWQGLTREEATRFAFLLSAPIIAGAGGVKLLSTLKLFAAGKLAMNELMFFAVGMVTAVIFGYLTIRYFMSFVSRHSLMPFVYYRIALGVIVLLLSTLH